MERRNPVTLLSLAFLIVCSPGFGQKTQKGTPPKQKPPTDETMLEEYKRGITPNIKSLRGIGSILINPVLVDEDAEKNGLRGEDIKADIAQKFRQSGIECFVFPSDLNKAGEIIAQSSRVPGQPSLNVHIVLSQTNGLYTWFYQVELRQMVTLQREETIVLNGVTWQDTNSGTAKVSNLNPLRDAIKTSIDKFCKNYLLVNPKK